MYYIVTVAAEACKSPAHPGPKSGSFEHATMHRMRHVADVGQVLMKQRYAQADGMNYVRSCASACPQRMGLTQQKSLVPPSQRAPPP
mmetsp:Transcript_37733/g.99770  ORF Transcript_37733/g.99770 Transcript_37733/m.99770 type:complete len:87 (-) Transcript_37733:1185-1445(-)